MGFPRLLPKNDQFLDMLSKLAEAVCVCPQYLKAYLEANDDASRARAGQNIADARHRSKEMASQITAELCRSYVTPFDRDDIQDFSAAMYKIPKIIEKIKDRLELHKMDGSDFVRQIDVIMEEASAMEDLVKDLVSKPDSRRIQDKVRVLYDLEARGDAILTQLLAQLFEKHHEARELILRKDIYDMLEKVIDRYRDAAGVALQIVLKHG